MSEFSHLKNKLLAEQVEDQIYHYILDEALEPGAKLPNEFALGEKFRVGRSTIREAVKLLSSKGIVEVRQGSASCPSSSCSAFCWASLSPSPSRTYRCWQIRCPLFQAAR